MGQWRAKKSPTPIAYTFPDTPQPLPYMHFQTSARHPIYISRQPRDNPQTPTKTPTQTAHRHPHIHYQISLMHYCTLSLSDKWVTRQLIITYSPRMVNTKLSRQLLVKLRYPPTRPIFQRPVHESAPQYDTVIDTIHMSKKSSVLMRSLSGL